jgi:hypothetical protein
MACWIRSKFEAVIIVTGALNHGGGRCNYSLLVSLFDCVVSVKTKSVDLRLSPKSIPKGENTLPRHNLRQDAMRD